MQEYLPQKFLPLRYSPTCLFICLFIKFIYLFTYSFIYELIYSFIFLFNYFFYQFIVLFDLVIHLFVGCFRIWFYYVKKQNNLDILMKTEIPRSIINLCT